MPDISPALRERLIELGWLPPEEAKELRAERDSFEEQVEGLHQDAAGASL